MSLLSWPRRSAVFCQLYISDKPLLRGDPQIVRPSLEKGRGILSFTTEYGIRALSPTFYLDEADVRPGTMDTKHARGSRSSQICDGHKDT
jgi:hypothetical protein